MSTSRAFAAFALALASSILVAPPPRAQAQDAADADAQAHIHFEAGQMHYQAGDFADAAREFEAAYALSARPPLLYNIYVARRDLGDRAGAADALRRYLSESTDLPDDQRRLHEARLHSLEEEIAAAQTAEATPAPAPAPAASSGMGIVPGIVVLSAGGAVLIASLIVGLVAQDTAGRYNAICDRTGDPSACPASDAATLNGLASDFELQRDLAWGFFGGGLAIAAAGAVLLGLGSSEGSGESPGTPTPSASCGPDGCRLVVTGSF